MKVDLSDVFTNLVMVARFSDSDQKLWTIAKQVKLWESLFPSKVEDLELGMEASNEAFKLFDEKKIKEGLGPKAADKSAAVNKDDIGDEEEDDEENVACTKAQMIAVAKAMPEGCDNMQAQANKYRTKSKRFLKKDTKSGKCGQPKCTNKGNCFTKRRKLH